MFFVYNYLGLRFFVSPFSCERKSVFLLFRRSNLPKISFVSNLDFDVALQLQSIFHLSLTIVRSKNRKRCFVGGRGEKDESNHFPSFGKIGFFFFFFLFSFPRRPVEVHVP